MSAQNKWSHAAAEVADLGAEVRKQPLDQTARVASLEKRRRKQDEPARRAYANQALALRFFVQFCGYAPSVKDTLNVAIEAAAGLGHAITRADWEMGLYLHGGSHAEAERLRALPAHDQEKRTLAKAWKRAYAEYLAEEKRTGIVALRRIAGTKDFKTGTKKASQIHALCAQDIAEIATAATKFHGRRFENFARAAEAHVSLLRDDPTRRASSAEPEPKPARIRQPATPALAVVRFLMKLEKAVDELIRDVSPELQAEARVHAESLLAQKFDADESTQDDEGTPNADDSVYLDLRKDRSTKSDKTDPDEAGGNTHLENTKPAKNAASDDGLAYNLYTKTQPKSAPPATSETYRAAITFALDEKVRAGVSLDDAVAQVEAEIGEFEDWLARMKSYSRPVSHVCPSPDVDPDLIAERVFIMCEAKDVSETEAAQIARRDLCETCHEAAKIARSRAVHEGAAFTRGKETATWQPPADFIERMEATFT